jgi:quercetin dioxygenase-like cupin family protein
MSSPIDLHPAVTRTERYVYVVRGDAELSAAGTTMRLSAGTLVIIPPGLPHVLARARVTGDVTLAEFARLGR